MSIPRVPALLLSVGLAACGVREEAPAAANGSERPVTATVAPAARQESSRTILEEPRGPIDPKSVEAAGQVVQSYGALLEAGHFPNAAEEWGDRRAAEAFARQFGGRTTHLQIGNLGAAEGAAGSVYTTVPVVFYGEGFSRPANIILRRVNDVPGSTEAQRRWHIERIDWTAR
ncbi:MAG TPA: hypothetical protein VIL42_07190 [Sphingomicrobium sp.]|jgi:hypothetical protein